MFLIINAQTEIWIIHINGIIWIILPNYSKKTLIEMLNVITCEKYFLKISALIEFYNLLCIQYAIINK